MFSKKLKFRIVAVLLEILISIPFRSYSLEMYSDPVPILQKVARYGSGIGSVLFGHDWEYSWLNLKPKNRHEDRGQLQGLQAAESQL